METKKVTAEVLTGRHANNMILNLDIFGSIGGKDGVRLVDVAAKLSTPNISEIRLRINSDGGDVTEGFAIYNMLAAHPARKTVRVEGLAASIASMIAMVGDEIEMVDGAFMMAHQPFAVTKGTASDLRSTAGTLDKMCSGMIQVYTERTKQSKDEILAILENETWMNAADAVKAGFADKVVSAKKVSVNAQWGNLTAYAHVPDAVQKMAELSQAKPKASGEDMDEDKVMAKLGELDEKFGKHVAAYSEFADKVSKKLFAEIAEEEEAPAPQATADELPVEEEEEEEGEEMKAHADTLKALAQATSEVAQMRAQLTSIARVGFEAKVSESIKSGKLLPSLKEWALGQTEENFDKYLGSLGDAKFPVNAEHKENASITPSVELTPQEKKLAKAFGLPEEAVIAYNKANPKK